MGQQQLLLIILGVIIVGIAIAVGLQLFQTGSIGANQDAMINDVMNISAHADQWRIRPLSMGGGGGAFDGGANDPYALPTRMEDTGNGTYNVFGHTENQISIRGESLIHDGWVELDYDADADDDGERFTWRFGGVFGEATSTQPD